MRKVLKKIAYGAAVLAGAPTILRSRGAGPILCYHNVVGDGHAVTGEPSLHIAASDFESHLHRLRKHYEFVPLADYAERLAAPGGARGLAVCTFDDAYSGVLTHALPLLADLNVPCTIFVVAEAPGQPEAFWWDDAWIAASDRDTNRSLWLEGLQGRSDLIRATCASHRALGVRTQDATPATWTELSTAVTAARGRVTLGVHSATHPSLDRISEAMLARETAGARSALQAHLPGPLDTFAYPYGRWDETARQAVAHAGFRMAVTLDPGRNDRRSDPLALKRLNVPASIRPDALELWAAGWRP